jgi:uncharacterized protein YjiS (DUF1127 family)
MNAMNAQTPNSELTFQLPTMSYINAKWEEPNLRVNEAELRAVRKSGFAVWLAGRAAAFRGWRAKQQGMAELQMMSDRELRDIGLNRSDLGRVFSDAHNRDLRARGTHA